MTQAQTDKEVDYEQDLHELPAGWSWIALGEICDAINGRAFKSTEWRESGVPIIRIQNLKDSTASFNYFQGDLDAKHKVNAGDLLFAWSGTPGTSFGAHIWNGPNAALNQHIFNVQFDRKQLDTKYLCYALNQNVSRYVAQAQGGVGLAHITKSKFMASKVPIAPLDQQKRIVAEIEKQFSRLDEAVANLKRVKANLKRYKAAVLKAAVEGRLVETEAELARREGRGFETGEQLLQRILETRRSQWFIPGRGQGKGKYKEPAAPETTALPELPEGWVWASVDQLIGDSLIGLDRGRDQQNSEGIGTPYVKMNNVTMVGEVTSEGMVYVDASRDEKERFNLQADDLLFNTRNSKELVGKVGIVRGLPNGAIYNNNLMRLRAVDGAVPNFLCSQMCSDGFRRRMDLVKKATTNVAAVYAKDLFPLPLALPPIAEQHSIVAEVDRRLSLLRETEAQVDANLRRATRLRSAVLHKSFSNGI